MKAYKPQNLDELKLILSEVGDNTSFIAGGTDWIINNRFREKPLDCLIYLGQILEMKCIEKRKGELFIGAVCTMTDLENHPLLTKEYLAIAEAASSMGSRQVRNRATIGGNIANASPASDLSAPLMCLGASVYILQNSMIKKIPIEKFFIGADKTLLNQKDVVIGFALPEISTTLYSHYYKLGFRKEVSVARFGVAVAIKVNDGIVDDAKVALSSIGPIPVRLPQIENLLNHKFFSEQTAKEAGMMLRDYIKSTSGREYKAWASIGVMEDALNMFLPNMDHGGENL
mgnify:CR=1 FL=1